MNLTLLGLLLNFSGSLILVIDAYMNLGKARSYYAPPDKKMKWKAEKYCYGQDGFLERVKFTKEEKPLLIALCLLSLGFFLQILDYII